MEESLPPFRLQPIFKDYLWGGTRLREFLQKRWEGSDRCAESWEVVDRPDAQSLVRDGPLAGMEFGTAVERYRHALFGHRRSSGRFPLLLKYLDCQNVLSVQVHPDDAYAASMTPPDLGKTEAWYIIHADPGSKIYAGLKTGIDRETLASAMEAGQTEKCLHSFEAKGGDCIFIPAGTVHALGAGLIVAEIQQSSDTTFRLFDWNRTDASGKSRPLHLHQALEVTDFQRGPISPQVPRSISDPRSRCRGEELVHCDKFLLYRWTALQERELPKGELCILMVVQGSLRLATSGFCYEYRIGDTIIVPATAGSCLVSAASDLVYLECRLPS